MTMTPWDVCGHGTWLYGAIKEIRGLLSEIRNKLIRKTADSNSVLETSLIPWRYRKQKETRQGCPLPEGRVQHDTQG